MALFASKLVAVGAVIAGLAAIGAVALTATSGVETMRALLRRPPNLSVAKPEIRAAKPAPALTSTPERESPQALPAPNAPDVPRDVVTPAATNVPETPRVADAAMPDAGDSTKAAAGAQGGRASPGEAAAIAPLASSAPAPTEGVQCGDTLCPPDKVCCNASCGTCAAPGEKCSQLVCGMAPIAESVPCGSNTCNVGERCCNASCGICARPGEDCDTQKVCNNAVQYPYSVVCGMATCNVGMVCCNPSCGLCAVPGEPCSQQPCG